MRKGNADYERDIRQNERYRKDMNGSTSKQRTQL